MSSRLASLTALLLPIMTACAGNVGGKGGDGDGGRPGDADGGGGGPSGDPDGGGGGPVGTACEDGLGPWTGSDHVPASQDPPCGLSPDEVPLFVSIGFDDNGYSGLPGSGADTGGVMWAVGLSDGRVNPDGSPVRFSFYLTSTYGATWMSESPTFVKRAWHAALEAGNEIGDHTHSHSHGAAFDVNGWSNEIQLCLDWLTKPFDPNESDFSPDDSKGIGADLDDLIGFRTPFLEYNDATLQVVHDLGFRYDTSIEDGFQYDMDGSNFNWPYTLDDGSPGHEILVKWGLKQPITPHPGLWELPVYPVIVPPDDRCQEYGVEPGFRARMKQRASWFDEEGGKITGFDYNLWATPFAMTKAEVLATLKYSIDQRLAGNRAPFLFGAHTDYYSPKYTGAPNATAEERQQAIEELLDWALAKPEVRVVPYRHVLDWVRNPTSLP